MRSAYGPTRPEGSRAARRRPRPDFPRADGAAAGVPLVALLPGAPARASRTSRRPARRCWSATTRAASPTTARSCCMASIATTPATGACVRWWRTSPFAPAGWPMSSPASAASGPRRETALPLLAARRAGRRVSRRPEGRREALPRAVPDGALRPGRVRPAGRARPRCRCSRWPSSAPRRSTPSSGKSPPWPNLWGSRTSQ